MGLAQFLEIQNILSIHMPNRIEGSRSTITRVYATMFNAKFVVTTGMTIKLLLDSTLHQRKRCLHQSPYISMGRD